MAARLEQPESSPGQRAKRREYKALCKAWPKAPEAGHLEMALGSGPAPQDGDRMNRGLGRTESE